MKRIHSLLFVAAALLPACDDDSTPATEGAPATLSAPAGEQEESTAAIKLEFLRVHLQSARFIAEGITEVPGYQLVHQELRNEEDGSPLLDDEGQPRTQGFWIETAASAAEKGYYLCQKDVARAEADFARPHALDITFTDEGARKMEKLTSSFEIGREMLAIVVNGKVYAAPVVQDTISRQTCMNCFRIPGERDAVVRSLQAAIAGNAPQAADELSQADSDAEAADDNAEIVLDSALPEAEQQAVRVYMLRRLLADVRNLPRQLADRERTTYGVRDKFQTDALKATPTDGLPPDYQAYVQACIRARDSRKAVASIADLPFLAVERTPEEQALIRQAIMEEVEIAATLSQEYPKAAEFISDAAVAEVGTRLINRPAFRQVCLDAMASDMHNADNPEEYDSRFALKIAELLEAEISSMLREMER